MKHHLISSQSWKKLLLPVLVAGSVLALPVSTWATLPNTGSGNLSVIFGSATYPALGNAQTGALNITAGANNTVLGWVNFSDGTPAGGNLATGDIINYILPSSTSSILNQVTGGVASTFNGGTIASTGKVYLLNTAGIVLNSGVTINAAAFYGSTVPETLSYFETNGNLQVFTATPPANSTVGNVTVDAGVQLSTIGGGGTIGFAGNNVTVAGGTAAGTVVGNLYLESQGGTINIATGTGGLTVGSASAGGNLNVISNGGNVNLAVGSNTTIFGTATINTVGASGNGNVADNTTTLFSATTAGTTSTINAGTGSTGGTVVFNNDGVTGAVDFASIGVIGKNVSIVDTTAHTIALGTSTINGTLAVSSTGGSISNTGAVAATGNITLTANAAGKTIAFSTSGNVGFGAISSSGAANTVTITGTGNLTFANAVTSPTVSITTTGGTYGGAGTITASTSATLSASGNVNLASVVSPKLSVTSTGGTISQQAATAITANTAATFNAPLINIANTGNDITSVVLLGGANGTAAAPNVFDDNATTAGVLTLKTGTNITGPLTVTMDAAGNGGIALGSATAADALSFGSTLALTAAGTGAITSPGALNVTVLGAVTANTTNQPITIGAAAAANNSSFGQIGGNSGTAAFSINEAAATNLGAITTTGALTVVSGGNIVNTGGSASVVNAGGGVALSAGTVAAPASVQIGSSSSSATITGTVTLNIASGLTLYDAPGAGGLTVATGANTVGSEAIWVTNNNALTVNGTSGFGTLSFNVKNGSVSVTDPTSIILTNLVDPTANAAAIGVTATAGSITLGSGVALNGSGTTTLTATGTGGSVADTANSPINIFGPLSVSSKGIAISNNTANSVGQVTLASSGSINYSEGSTVNLGSITASGASGTVTISSNTGSIIQGAGATAITIPAGYTAANFTAPLGVTLNLAGGNAINKSAVVSITANGTAGNSSIINNQQTVLGNVTVTNGTFSASTLASGGSITQAASTSIFEYGAATFTTQGAVVTLANSGNNFGGITIDTTNAGGAATGAAASVREAGTNNYLSVKTGTAATSSFTAVDDNSNIIETANLGIIAGGGASFTAKAGSITLNATGNNFSAQPILLVTAPGTGAAAVTDANGALVLADGTNVGGNLTATETGANGTISDNGASSTITVGGTLALMAPTAGTGSVTFSGSNSTFGALEVQAGSGASSLLDNGPLVLVPGSRLTGAGSSLSLTSGGNITTSGTGGSNFAGSVKLIASGSIVITNSFYVGAGLTVDAIAGPTNLSFLSKTGDLNSIAVVNAGSTSNYTGPSP